MSDQTPPTDAPTAGGYPPPPSPPVPPVAPPVSSDPNPQHATPPYPYPSAAQYPGAQQYPSAPQYPGAPAYPSAPAGYYPGTYPQGYAAGPSPAAAPAKQPGGLGLTALLLALAAAVVAPIVGAVAAFQVGNGSWSWSRMETMPSSAWADLSFLSPVREWVLLGEIAFWAGTALGIWAIVQGIVAIVKRRGRGTGIAAVAVAVIALFIFLTVVYGAGIAGIATGPSMTSGSGIGA